MAYDKFKTANPKRLKRCETKTSSEETARRELMRLHAGELNTISYDDSSEQRGRGDTPKSQGQMETIT